MLLGSSEGIRKPLIMHDLALAKVLDGILDIGIVHQFQDIIVGGARLLLGRHILDEIGNRIALGLQIRRREGDASRRGGINTDRMIDKISIKALADDLIRRKMARQLGNDRADNFKMGKLLGTY